MLRERRSRPKRPTTSLVTTGVVEDIPVFSDSVCSDILIRAVQAVQQSHRFEVLAYVIMPAYFRWIVHLGRGRSTISDVMRDLKKQSAWEIMSYLEKEHSYGALTVFFRNARSLDDQRRRFWRPHFDETVIGDLETLRSRIEAIHEEPVRAGLAGHAAEYRFSSARNHLLGDHAILPVTPLSALEWIA